MKIITLNWALNRSLAALNFFMAGVNIVYWAPFNIVVSVVCVVVGFFTLYSYDATQP